MVVGVDIEWPFTGDQEVALIPVQLVQEFMSFVDGVIQSIEYGVEGINQ